MVKISYRLIPRARPTLVVIVSLQINGLVCNDLCSCGCTIDVVAELVACALQSPRVWVHKRAPEQAPHMGEPLKLQPVTDAMNILSGTLINLS